MRSFQIAALLIALLVHLVAVAETTAITGATVHTAGPAGTVEGATVLLQDGRIAAMGTDVVVPADAKVIEATGKRLTPGLFSAVGALGLVEVSGSAGPLDAVQRGDRFTAGFDVASAFNRRSTLIAVNRVEGVTRALISPEPSWPEGDQRSHVFSGLASIVQLGDTGEAVTDRAVAVVMSLGESGAGLAGESRASALMLLQQALKDARDYQRHRVAWERGNRREYGFSAADLEALQPALTGAIPLLVDVHRASDIEALLALAETEGLRVIVRGAAEAWLVAEQLATANAGVILSPTSNLPASFDRLNARRDAAAMLHAAGVTIAFTGPEAHTHNARNMTQEAGNAVSAGLPWEAALRAITHSPAVLYGVGDQIGTIEVGKEADLVLWPDDPLELRSYPEQVFVRGAAISMISRQTLLRDRYLNVSEVPPAFRPR